MEYQETAIKGVWVLTPKVFYDDRGYFFESYNEKTFQENVGNIHFVQDNQSKSSFGVLRGLHYQKGEYSQAKLVRVLSGKVLDVAVDLRKDSPTFAQYVSVELSEENGKQLFIPRGFAHGFLVLSPTATFAYKVDNAYNPKAEVSIAYNDPTIQIAWPIDLQQAILSLKDKQGIPLTEAPLF